MRRLSLAVLVVAGLALAAETARAQAPATTTVPAGSFVYSNGYYYYRPAATTAYRPPVIYAGQPYTAPGTGTRADSAAGYYSHNGVLRGPSGAMSGRVRHDFDPTGRGVQLYKPWLQPIR